MSVFIPRRTIETMRQRHLSEAQLREVVQTGARVRLPSGKDAIVRHYHGYEVGAVVVRRPVTDELAIIGVWKRERR